MIAHQNDESTYTSLKDSLLFPYTFFIKEMALPFIMLPGLFLLVINYRKYNSSKIIAIFTFITLIIWIAILKDYWFNERFIFALLALFVIFSMYVYDRYYYRYRWLRVLLSAAMVCLLLYFVYDNKRFLKYSKFILNKEDRMTWSEQNTKRAPRLLSDAAKLLNDKDRMFILKGGVLFMVPYEKLQYVNSEQDHILYEETPDKAAFLRSRNYTYVFASKSTKDSSLPDFLDTAHPVFDTDQASLYRLK
jgi:hypothetical protein